MEFAILAPVLFMLLFGTLTGGIAVFQKLAVENAGRDAARWGATLPVENHGAPPPVADAWFAEIANHAIEAGSIAFSSDAPDRYICVAYVHQSDLNDASTDTSKFLAWDDTVATPTADNETSSGTGSSGQCFSDQVARNQAHVQVQLSRTVSVNAVLYQSQPTVDVRSVARYEPPPFG